MDIRNVIFSFLVFFSSVFGGELNINKPIFNNKAVVVWSPNTDKVDGYVVYVVLPNKVVEYTTHDTLIVIDLSNHLNDITRVYFYVKAYRGSLFSLPSDTVNCVFNKERRIFGDYNNDGKIDGIDAVMFWASYGYRKHEEGYNSIFDANIDGRINGFDHLYFINAYGMRLNSEDF